MAAPQKVHWLQREPVGRLGQSAWAAVETHDRR